MARKRGRPIHGWLNLDKPAGMSSARALELARRAVGADKAGHAGTLDPFATGVLPLAFGEATKTVRFMVETTKKYRFTVQWGEERSTDDPEGEVTERSDNRPSAAEIAAVLPSFLGSTLQVPPAYSALKVAGERAYDLARAGETFTLEPRAISIEGLVLVETPDPDCAVIDAVCGKGAYMRALARDLARRLGTRGHLRALCRTRVGRFRIEDAISLAKLQELGHSAGASPPLVPIPAALGDLPALALPRDEADRLRSGQPVPVLRTEERRRLEAVGEDGMVLVTCGSDPVAVARVEGLQVRPVRVLNVSEGELV